MQTFSFTCFIAAMMDRRATLEIFKCEHGHDVMKLCRQLAGNSVTLYTVAVAMSKPAPSYLPDPVLALMADFFTGISLKTGGQFIQIQNIKLISEVNKKCLCCGLNLSLVENFSNQFDFSLIHFHYHDLKPREIILKLV